METILYLLQFGQNYPGTFFEVYWAREPNIIKENQLSVINYKNWVKTALMSMVSGNSVKAVSFVTLEKEIQELTFSFWQ